MAAETETMQLTVIDLLMEQHARIEDLFQLVETSTGEARQTAFEELAQLLQIHEAAEAELDPVKRAAHFIRMNDIVVQANVVVPLIHRNWVAASSRQIRGVELSGWDSTFWRLPYWHREA